MKNKQASEFYKSLAKEEILCPITGSNEWDLILQGDRYGMGIETRICVKSGFVATNPRPTEDELNRFYKESYRDYYFGFSDPATEEYQNSANRLVSERRATWLVDFCIFELQNKISSKANLAPDVLRILDIGCGDGCFISAMKKRLVDLEIPSVIMGLELDEKYANFASSSSGCEVRVASIYDFMNKKPQEKYDLIVLSHVLEHLCRPDEVIGDLSKFLNVEGLMLVEVPNILSPAWSGLGMFHLAHINHFFPETLVSLFRRQGFELNKIFNSVHPADPWAMTALFVWDRGHTKTLYDPDENLLAAPLYGENRLGVIKSFIHNRALMNNHHILRRTYRKFRGLLGRLLP